MYWDNVQGNFNKICPDLRIVRRHSWNSKSVQFNSSFFFSDCFNLTPWSALNFYYSQENLCCLFIHFYSRDDLEVNFRSVLAVLISVEIPLFWNSLCLILILIVIIFHSVSLFYLFIFFFSKTLHHQFIYKEGKTFSLKDFRLVRYKAVPAIAPPIELTN